MSKNNNIWAIRLLTNTEIQTEEMCLYVVGIYGKALKFVDNQTYLVCVEAIRQDKEAIDYIRWNEANFTEEQIRELNILSSK
ncbi:hypothetical protein KGF51_14755 [Clostridioides sp. ZZV14-6045]|uniref:hypothetical protein n=1 Tax=Clostridioides sp. ZZV14-6045 TaxID=2811489 RepID=UPI001D120490|nr:hypothetical protein [Clostridioides sp. ZZV14-6045]